MALEVFGDSLNGEPIAVVLGAAAWQQPTEAGWLERSKAVNQLLRRTKRATHLLRVVDESGEQETWYAGRPGISLAAGIERLAVNDESVRDATVVLQFDSRSYFAELNGTLVVDEGGLYPKAFDERARLWRDSGREVIVFDDVARRQLESASCGKSILNVDLATLTFRHATLTMLRAGIVRWRDCVMLLLLFLLACAAVLAHSRWLQTSANELPVLIQLPQIVSPPAPRFQAAAEIAALALAASDHDVALWDSVGVSQITYDPENDQVALFRQGEEKPLLTHELAISLRDSPPSNSLSLANLRELLREIFSTAGFSVAFHPPFDFGDVQIAQKVVATVNEYATTRLIDLAATLKNLPIQLRLAECRVVHGVLTDCELTFSIQGPRANR